MPKIETDYTDYITCPYCGTEMQDSWDVRSAEVEFDDGVIECGECEKEFFVSRQCSVTYSTRTKD